jgi:hypothetical protein
MRDYAKKNKFFNIIKIISIPTNMEINILIKIRNTIRDFQIIKNQCHKQVYISKIQKLV